jgi:hypothetical protein
MIDFSALQTWAVGLLPFALGFFILMILDFATGALCAWYDHRFSWEEAPRFLQVGILYLWAWLTAEALAFLPVLLHVEIPTYGQAIADVAPKAILASIAVGKYVSSMVNNIKLIISIRNEKPWEPAADDKTHTGAG